MSRYPMVLMSCDTGEGLNFFLGAQQTKTKMAWECSLDQNSEASRVTTVFLVTRSKSKITCKGLIVRSAKLRPRSV